MAGEDIPEVWALYTLCIVGVIGGALIAPHTAGGGTLVAGGSLVLGFFGVLVLFEP